MSATSCHTLRLRKIPRRRRRRMRYGWFTQILFEPRSLLTAAAGPSLDHLKRLLDAQRSAHLAWRILFERLEESSNEGYGGDHRPKLIAPPAGIHHRLVLIAFPRILPQVGHERNVGRFLRAGEQISLDRFEAEFPIGVSHGREVAIVREVEEFLPRSLGDVAFQERLEVVPVEVGLEGFVAHLEAVQKFSLNVGLTGSSQKRRHEVLTGYDVVDDTTGLDRARPLRDHGDAESALKRCALLAAEWGIATIRPTEGLGAIVAGEDHDGIVGNAEVVQLLENAANCHVQLHDGVGVQAVTALVLPLRREMGPHMGA